MSKSWWLFEVCNKCGRIYFTKTEEEGVCKNCVHVDKTIATIRREREEDVNRIRNIGRKDDSDIITPFIIGSALSTKYDEDTPSVISSEPDTGSSFEGGSSGGGGAEGSFESDNESESSSSDSSSSSCGGGDD